MQALKALLAAAQGETQNEMSLSAYLDGCKEDPLMYATAARRLREAIGKGVPVDKTDLRNARLFKDETVLEYSAFSDFFGIPRVIQRVVDFIDGAAKGLQPYKQILFLVGPPSTGKSSLARRIMQLMGVYPIYVLKAGDEISPYLETPLCLFQTAAVRKMVSDNYGIPLERMNIPMSPWVFRHLQAFNGDLTKFTVVRIMPSLAGAQGLAKVEPYDTYDLTKPSPLVAGLMATGQGLLEFVEMFRLLPAQFNPLFSASEDREFSIPGQLGSIPYQGVLIGHSNVELWTPFSKDKNNAALLSRIHEIWVPYTTQLSAEKRIYQVHLAKGGFTNDNIAPATLDLLAALAVLSRVEGVKSVPYAQVLDGHDPKAVGSTRLLTPGENDGRAGLMPRATYGWLAHVLTANQEEVRADPVSLLGIVQAGLRREYSALGYEKLLSGEILPYYVGWLGLQLQHACVEDYDNFGQFELTRYVRLVEAWDRKEGYKNPETEEILDNDEVVTQLGKLEQKMGVLSDPKEFRDKMLKFWLRYRSAHGGATPEWLKIDEYQALVDKLTTMTFGEIWEIIVRFRSRNAKEQLLHDNFVERFCKMGYTELEAAGLTDWWIQQKLAKDEMIPEKKESEKGS